MSVDKNILSGGCLYNSGDPSVPPTFVCPQVRRALEQVEVLRKQQSGREARAAAAYEGRLSAYVKQMVGVQRENEELRAGQPAHQVGLDVNCVLSLSPIRREGY